MSRKRHNRRAKTPATPRQPVPPTPPASAAPPPAPAAQADPLADGAGSDEAAVMFFSAPPVTHSTEPLLPEPPPERAPVRRIGDAARRRDLARYVTGAVAVCFLICVAAAVRAGTVRADTHASVPHSTPRPVPAVQVPAPAANEPAAAAASPEVAAQQPPETVSQPEPVNAPSPDHAAKAEDDKGAPLEDARAAKRRAQRAIDRGDATGAIEAARQSLDLDESDAETWLILGAAYMQRGAHRDAQETFAGCVRKATHGDRGECRALLR